MTGKDLSFNIGQRLEFLVKILFHLFICFVFIFFFVLSSPLEYADPAINLVAQIKLPSDKG